VISPIYKEIFYFDEFYEKGQSWYESHFPLLKTKDKKQEGTDGTVLTSEATITYLTSLKAPERLFKYHPDVKILVMLRNPLNRAFSHYKHAIRINNEKRDFTTAIKVEHDRLEREGITEIDSAGDYYDNTQYLVRGRYYDHLKRWFEYFPREQFLIMTSEDYFKDAEREFDKVTEFLGLTSWKPGKFAVINVAPSKDPMEEKDREFLSEYFKPYNEKLYKLLGRDLGWDNL
jgi:hypothetical protein